MKFSVVMSVYRNDKTEYVAKAIESITVKQTRCPDEIVLVVDGPVSSELRSLISEYEQSSSFGFKVIRLRENKGLGNALKIGIEQASNEIIARMDSDDISVPNRFEKQIGYMETHPQCDLLGGQITEFIDRETNVVCARKVPCTHEKILMWLKGRSPFNHMSVTMLRSRVIACGNYLDWHFNEDYYLWIRMALAGCRFANLPDVLVNVRIGKDMYARRGGWRYFKSEAALQKYMLANRGISPFRYLFNVSVRFVVQVMMPNRIRGFVFQKLFRKAL